MPIENGERHARIRQICAAVSEIDPEKWPVWSFIKSRADDVEFRAINADSGSITLNKDKLDFAGIFHLNLLVTFKEGKEKFKTSDYVTGRFTGCFDQKGKAEIKDLTIYQPEQNKTSSDEEDLDI